MNLIKITPLTKRRVKDITVGLLPEYNYVRVTRRGIVILKKKWWSFNKTIVNITDLFIDVFPKKLAESCKRKGYGDAYERVFSNDIYVMMQLKSYKKDVDIVEYIWKKYNKLHREVPTFSQTIDLLNLNKVESNYLPILSPVSSLFIPGIEKFLKRYRKKDSVESLIEKISKLHVERVQYLISRPFVLQAA